MPIQPIKFSEGTKIGIEKIIAGAKKRTTLGEQMHMASYFAYLHSEKVAANDAKNFAKISLAK